MGTRHDSAKIGIEIRHSESSRTQRDPGIAVCIRGSERVVVRKGPTGTFYFVGTKTPINTQEFVDQVQRATDLGAAARHFCKVPITIIALFDGGGLYAVTDYSGEKALYAKRTKTRTLISSDADQLDCQASEPDQTQILSFVLNGQTLGPRTLWADIEVLPAGVVIDILNGCRVVDTYFSWARQIAEPELDVAKSRSEFLVSLTESLNDQLRGRDSVLCLSGGVDSGIILAAWQNASASSFTCFSWVDGTPMPGSDAAVAAAQSKSLNIPHFIVDVSANTPLDVILENRRAGLTERAPSLEIFGFGEVRRKSDDIVFLSGDNLIDASAQRLDANFGAIGGIKLHDPRMLGRLVPVENFDDATRQISLVAAYTDLLDGAHASLAEMGIEPSSRQLRDLLFISQTYRRNVFQLREYTLGRQGEYLSPLVHRDIASQLVGLPLRDRNDKLFMRQVLEDRRAEMGRVSRARKPQSYDPSKIFQDENFDVITRWISESGIRIPSFLDSNELVATLTRLKVMHGERRSAPSVFSKQWVRASVKRISTSLPWGSELEWRARERWFNSYTDAPALPMVAFHLCSLGATFSINEDRSGAMRQLYPV